MLTNLRTWFCRSVMTLLLMLPITLGWAGGYIHYKKTSDSNWSKADLAYKDAVGTVAITLDAGETYEFLFVDKGTDDKSNNSYGFSGNPQDVTDGTLYPLSANGSNGRIPTATGGTYTFTVTWDGGKPSISVRFPANAQSTLKFSSNKNNWGTSDAMVSQDDGKTWSYTLDVTNYPTDVFDFRFVEGTNKYIVPKLEQGETISVPINNEDPISAEILENNHNNRRFTFTGSGKYLTYLIKVEYANNAWGVYVLGQDKFPDYYINSNGTQVKGLLKNNKYYFTLPNSCYTNGKLEFSISKSSNTTTYLTANERTFFGHKNTQLTGITDGTEQETKFSYTTNGLVNDDPDGDIEVVYDSKANTLTLYYKSRQEVMESAFYLIVPNANVGNTRRAVPASEGIAPKGHTAFRLMAGRERNNNVLNDDLTSINLKIDGDKGQQLRYDSEEKIKFYIQKGNQKKFFQPTNNEDDIYVKKTAKETDNKTSGYYGETATNGVDGYGVRSHQMSDSDENRYFIITKTDADEKLSSTDKANNYKTMSLTFMFSENNGEHSFIRNKGNDSESVPNGNAVNGFQNNGNLIVGFQHTRGVGSAYYNNHIKEGRVYLVGAMGGDYTSDRSYSMKKMVYPANKTDESADSIVYVCDVKKGDNTWDNFFLSFSTGDVVGNNHWNLLLRPHVQDQMDGQALEGGVFFFKNDTGTDNQQQALNPLLSEAQKQRYVSYKVYFNATYSTYRIEFYDNFYIAGPAVHGQKDNTVNGGEYFDKAHRKAMRTEEVHGVRHYVYTGEFTNGSTFAFFVNPETYTYNYSEDGDSQNVTGNTGTMWTTQAPTGEGKDGKDYPFYNHVRWNTDGINPEGNTSGSLGQSNNGIKWTLPTGTYTLRFYNHAEKSGNNQLYTIDKVVTLKNATSEFVEKDGASVKHNYGGWRTFSDDCALWLPNGIKAYYASEITAENKVKLTEVKDGMIPAHTGVLIYDGNLLAGSESEDIHLYPVPTDYTTELGETNLFVDCYDRDYTISYHPQNGKYNYFFTCFYKKLGDFSKSNVPMNFWKTRDQNAKAKKNYTYLQVSDQINPSAFNSETKNYEPEPSATNVANNARDYCFLFSLDDLDDPLVTGITAPAVENSMETKAEGWYTMQGVKIQKPVKAGMYIHNGRKVIVR